MTITEKQETIISFKPHLTRSKNKRLFWFLGTICAIPIVIVTAGIFAGFAYTGLAMTIPQAIGFGFVCLVLFVGFGLITS